MAGELLQPGVSVIQVQQTASPSFTSPTLVPCVVGPAFEVINVLSTDGTINSKAQYGAYTQIGSTITESAFPNPRGNIDELDVQANTVRPFMYSSGLLNELLMNPGESFLTTSHGASAAVMTSAAFNGGTGLALSGKLLVFSLDNPTWNDTSEDYIVTFTGTGNLTALQAAAQINAVVGKNVATTPGDVVQIQSSSYGALSSITIRAGGSANALVQFGVSSDPGTSTTRVEGSGYRGQDDGNNDTVTPWIEFYTGAYLTGVSSLTSTDFNAQAGLINVETQTFVSAAASAVTFGPTGTIPINVGDYIYVDGSKLANGEISKVEPTRFKIGTINTTLSVADSNGRYTTKVYNPVQVGTVLDPSPLAPKYVWYKATNLNWLKVSPTAGSTTGTVIGEAATAGVVTTGSITFSVTVAGLTLDYTITVDGVDTDNSLTLTGGPYSSASDLAAAISIPGITVSAVGNTIVFTTVKTGRLQAFSINATGTANSILELSTSSSTTGTGTDVTFPALVQTSGQIFPTTAMITGGAKTIKINISTDGGNTFPTTQTFTKGSTEWANVAAAVTEINSASSFTTISSVLTLKAVAVGTELRIKYVPTTPNVVIKVDSTSTGLQTSNAGTMYYTASQTGMALNGANLEFQKNNNPHVFNVVFTDNSLSIAVADINTATGVTNASITGGGANQLTLSTVYKGSGSNIAINSDCTAATILGVSTSEQSGSGRPFPDAYQDSSNNLVIGFEIIRDPVTGYPVDQDYISAILYIQFKALRKDVSAVATTVGVLNINDIDVLGDVLDPLTSDNPLGLGLYLCMLNAPNLVVKGLGIDDIANGASPTGTLAAHARAAALLEAEEVYAIAPLTQDEVIHGLWASHVLAMSDPTQGGERIAFINKVMPTYKNPIIALSGTEANSTATDNQLLLDANPASGLVTAGLNPALPFAVSDGVYVEFNDAEGNFLRYNISSVSGALVNFNITFSGSDNTDGFYTTDSFTSVVVDAPYSLKVRGASMIIPGSNPARLDYSLVANTVSDANASLKNRRLFSVFPDTVQTVINGVTQSIPGYYVCAAKTGMVAAQAPQQGFTNLPIIGFTGSIGPEKFTKSQLNIMAGGGTYIVMQEVAGGAVFCRHQLSTDLSSIETRELSITKDVDFVAKFLRLGIRQYIGTQIINTQLLDTIGTALHGMLLSLTDNGVLIDFQVNSLQQDTSAPDTVLVDVTLQVPYPCNYIQLTLAV